MGDGLTTNYLFICTHPSLANVNVRRMRGQTRVEDREERFAVCVCVIVPLATPIFNMS